MNDFDLKTIQADIDEIKNDITQEKNISLIHPRA